MYKKGFIKITGFMRRCFSQQSKFKKWDRCVNSKWIADNIEDS